MASAEACKISAAHPVVLKVALSHAIYYHDVLCSVEFAMKIIGETVSDAREDFYGFKRSATDQELKDY